MVNSMAIVALAALIHASFQLSVSVLTLLGSHAIGNQTSHARLLRLTNGFFMGVAVMTMLMIAFAVLLFSYTFGQTVPPLVWSVSCGLLMGVGIAVWAFYYRREPGTSLWIPRSIARYLSERTKVTSQAAEAFGLGLMSVVGEFIFILAPMIVSGLVLIQLQPIWQLVGIALYTTVSLLSLLIVNSLIGSGHKISVIQKYREDNKHFLQFAAGSGLIVLGLYLYVDQLLTAL